MLSDALPDTFIFHAAAFNVTVTFTLSPTVAVVLLAVIVADAASTFESIDIATVANIIGLPN